MRRLNNEELKAKTDEFRRRLSQGETEDDLLPEAFAVVREASRRVLGLRPFDSQLIGGMVLNDGRIAEMKTGEGKTLVAALPSYLNAISGKGAHVVTVNDYLAKRDAENIGQIHKALGLSVGIIQAGMTPIQRRAAYGCDITYATNSEIGFDYLRDNLAQTEDDLVMRGFNFCVIDEADSILIDEARTPLIISGPAEPASERYQIAKKLADALVRDIHYEVDEKKKSATLSDDGYDAAAEVLRVTNIEEEGWGQYITTAIKAKDLFQRNIDYIVKDNEVIIVDEFTGRTMPGRRWSNGQHQAIEAKENVDIQRETITIASITYQNLFRGYNKLSGMTGTGDTEAGEFYEIYDMSVSVVPTNKPNLRKDFDDVVFTGEPYKVEAIVKEVDALHGSGRPILVGTTSVQASETLSQQLREEGVKHEVLNARPENIERESEIIAQSGRKGAVTIATNMAGRGTDILLGGNPEYMARLKVREKIMPLIVNLNDGIDRIRPLTPNSWKVLTKDLFPCNLTTATAEELESVAKLAMSKWGLRELTELEAEDRLSAAFEKGPLEDEVLVALREVFNKVEGEYKAITSKEKREVVALGGLHVIGTERHESRRIDNQLRGRAGRQGDPGSTRFFLSLDDQLFRLFGGDKIKNFMQQMNIDDRPLESGLVKNSLDDAQEKVEGYFFNIRKTLFEYDVVVSGQRRNYYENRRQLLVAKEIEPFLIRCAEAVVDEVIDQTLARDTPKGLWIPLLARIGNKLRTFSPTAFRDVTGKGLWQICDGDHDILRNFLRYRAIKAYWDKVAEVNEKAPGCAAEAQRYIFLQSMDKKWQDHLAIMEELNEGVQFSISAERDPLVEYKIMGSNLYRDLFKDLRQNVFFAWCNFDPPPNLAEALRVNGTSVGDQQDLQAQEVDSILGKTEDDEKTEEITQAEAIATAAVANDLVARGVEALRAEFPDMITARPIEQLTEEDKEREKQTAE